MLHDQRTWPRPRSFSWPKLGKGWGVFSFLFIPSHPQSTCCAGHNHLPFLRGSCTLFPPSLQLLKPPHSSFALHPFLLSDPSPVPFHITAWPWLKPYALWEPRSGTATRSMHSPEEEDLITTAYSYLQPVSHWTGYTGAASSPQGCFVCKTLFSWGFFFSWKAGSLTYLMKHSAVWWLWFILLPKWFNSTWLSLICRREQ